MHKIINVTIPDEVMEEAGLLFYDNDQLMAEMERRGVTPTQYKAFFAMQYAKAQIADAKDEIHG